MNLLKTKKQILLISVVLLLHSTCSFSQKLDTLVFFQEIQKKNIEIKKLLMNTECGNVLEMSIFYVLLVGYKGEINKSDFMAGKFLEKIEPKYSYRKKHCRLRKSFIKSDAYLFDEKGHVFATMDGNAVFCKKINWDKIDSLSYLSFLKKILWDFKPKVAFNIIGTPLGIIFIIDNKNEIHVAINDNIICSVPEFVELYWTKSRFITE